MAGCLLNIHGFMGSADNKNLRALKRLCLDERLISPAVDYLREPPGQILERLSMAVRTADSPVIVVGQSLGGWFANQISLRFRIPCILTNPCLFPHQCSVILDSQMPLSYLQEYKAGSGKGRNPLCVILCSRDDEVLPGNYTACQNLSDHVRLVNGTHSQIENLENELKYAKGLCDHMLPAS